MIHCVNALPQAMNSWNQSEIPNWALFLFLTQKKAPCVFLKIIFEIINNSSMKH